MTVSHMLQTTRHEPSRNAAPTIAGHDGNIRNLPAAAIFVGPLHSDISDYPAIFYPDEATEYIIEVHRCFG